MIASTITILALVSLGACIGLAVSAMLVGASYADTTRQAYDAGYNKGRADALDSIHAESQRIMEVGQ